MGSKFKIPKGHILWVTYNDKDGQPKYIVTSDKIRDTYYLYSVKKDGSLTKVKSAKQPVFKELEK